MDKVAQKNFHEEYSYICFANSGRKAYITSLARLFPSPHYHMVKRSITRCLIDYVVSGRGYVDFAGVRHTVTAGDLIFIKKDISVNYGSDSDEPYEKLWFACDGVFVDSLCTAFLDGRELLIVHEADRRFFDELKTLLENFGHDEEKICHLLLDLFMWLGKHCTSSDASENRSGLAERIKACLDDESGRFATLDDLAAHFHISARHVSRIFTEKYGTPPIAYRCEKRLNSAARYLTETHLTIAEIASCTGYSDQSRFSTSFKKHFGIYPTEYRRRYK